MDIFANPSPPSQQDIEIHYPYDIRERFIARLLYEAFSDEQKRFEQEGNGKNRVLSVEDRIAVEMGEVFRSFGVTPLRYYDRNNITKILRSGIHQSHLDAINVVNKLAARKLFKDVLHMLFHRYDGLIRYWKARGREDTLEWWGYERWALKSLIVPFFVGPDWKDCNWVAIGEELQKQGQEGGWPARKYTTVELQGQVRSEWAFYFMAKGTSLRFFGRCQKLQASPEDHDSQECAVHILPTLITA